MFNNIYKNKNVLVTGNTGFKGSWLTLWLKKLGANLFGISNKIPTEPSMFEILDLESQITQIYEDIRDTKLINKYVNEIKPDFIFHLAAQPLVSISYYDPINTISANVMGTANVLDSLKESDFECTCIIITSDKCYNNIEQIWGYKEIDELGGKDIYSGSKGAAELIFKSYYHTFYHKSDNIRIATARAGNVIGGGDWAKDRIIPDCIRAWSDNLPVEIRCPTATRPWQHVLEPLSGYLELGNKVSIDDKFNGDSFNFGPHIDDTQTVIKILKDIAYIWGFKNEDDSYVITDKIPFHEATLLKLNCEKALHLFKWKPTLKYNELIRYTGEWYYNYYNNENNMLEFTMNQISEYENLASDREIVWSK